MSEDAEQTGSIDEYRQWLRQRQELDRMKARILTVVGDAFMDEMDQIKAGFTGDQREPDDESIGKAPPDKARLGFHFYDEQTDEGDDDEQDGNGKLDADGPSADRDEERS